jgi:hypothetical protein
MSKSKKNELAQRKWAKVYENKAKNPCIACKRSICENCEFISNYPEEEYQDNDDLTQNKLDKMTDDEIEELLKVEGV